MNTEVTSPEGAETEQARKMTLNVEVEKVSACERHIKVSIPREEVDIYYEKQFEELVPQAEIPGFRPGKAPKKLIQKMYRKQVDQQVKSGLIIDSLAQIQSDADFSPISEPDLEFDGIELPAEGDFFYEFNIEVRPEFDLPSWKGLQLERPEHEFTDEEIDQEIAQFSARFSDLIPVDDAVQMGDFIACNIETLKDETVLSTDEEVLIQVRPSLNLADGSIDQFADLVVGRSAGDVVTTSVKVNDFSDNEKVRGELVDLKIEILDVKRVDSEQFNSNLHDIGFKDENELKEQVRATLFKNLQYQQRRRVRDQITELLTAGADWDLPPDLLRRQSKREIERAAMELRSADFSEQEVLGRLNEMRSNILENTATFLKEHFILEKIAEVEEVEDTPQDYEAEILKLSIQQNDSPRRVRARLERQGQMDALRNMILEQKVIDLITQSGTFKPVPYEYSPIPAAFALEFYAGGKTAAIPSAKQDGGDLPAIPGTGKDK